MTTRLSESRCPSCGSDWIKLEDDLSSELVWVEWPNPLRGGFLGKSVKQIVAETIINRCGQCKEHFKGLKGE